MRVPNRLVELREQRVDPFLRTFEWTWTSAVTFCLALLFFSLITMIIMPSFWMYFAEERLGWAGPSGGGNWFLELRDAIAMGLTTGPLVTVFALGAFLQNYRRRLRGRTGDTRPTGGYR